MRRFAFDQVFVDEIVSSSFKHIQIPHVCTALKSCVFVFFTLFGETCLILKKKVITINKSRNQYTYRLVTYLFPIFLGGIFGCHMFPIFLHLSIMFQSIGFFPNFFVLLCILGCEFLEHLWIDPVVEVLVILVGLHFGQHVLCVRGPELRHVVGLPLAGVPVGVGSQAAVVPVLVDGLATQE